MNAKIQPLSIKELQDVAVGLIASPEVAALTALEIVLDRLQTLMPEQEFCRFCDLI